MYAALHCQSISQTCFSSYFQKGKIFPFRKESIFPFWKNHPLLEDAKFKLLLCMLLVFRASRNVSFNDDNHILKFFIKGFKNLLSSFFLIPTICYKYWAVHMVAFILLVREVSFRHSQQDRR